METFLLIRHGERVNPREDTSLAEAGRAQAELTGRYLSEIGGISLVYASPLRRTQETAEIFSRHLGLPIITDARLLERILWEDSHESYKDFIIEWIRTSRNRRYIPPGRNSSFDAGNRLKSLVDEIPSGQKAVIVSHYGAIGDFLRTVFDDGSLPMIHDPDTSVDFIDLLTCSVTEITRQDGVYRLQRVGDVAHLIIPRKIPLL